MLKKSSSYVKLYENSKIVEMAAILFNPEFIRVQPQKLSFKC